MNVFEDLIGALKEENLIEETVIETQKIETGDNFIRMPDETDFVDSPETLRFKDQAAENSKNNFSLPPNASVRKTDREIIIEDYSSISSNENEVGLNKSDTEFAFAKPLHVVEEEKKPEIDEKEFYRKRAIEEVSGLQMVEHVLSGVEREQNKTAAAIYNDIAVKKALHDFLQISEDVKSPEHAQAEFRLMQETETWCSALSRRDERVSVAHLRRYCETTKPPLSSQALISLARFYRNLPYTETVRSKFDLVVTRLFSKDIGGDKRVMIFTRGETVKHIAELYAEWSSLSLYSNDEDESKIISTVLKYEEFIAEAESAESFDRLVNNDFFNRLRLFKESTEEVFYAPLITATTVESNVRIGNKYVDLIEIEREKLSPDNLQEKYDFLNEQAISDSTSKTLQLIGLLKEIADEDIASKTKKIVLIDISDKPAEGGKETKTSYKPYSSKNKKQTKNGLFAVNKWLLSATVIVALLSFGLYFWANYATDEVSASSSVKKVNLENSSLKEHVQAARISGNTFYGVMEPKWDALSLEKKEELLKKIFSYGAEKGYTKVYLLNKEGKTIGNATAEKAEVITR